MKTSQSLGPTCPNCGADVPPGKTFCRLSCRVKHEHRESARTPKLFPSELTLETELPSAEEVAEARRQRGRIAKLYRRTNSTCRRL